MQLRWGLGSCPQQQPLDDDSWGRGGGEGGRCQEGSRNPPGGTLGVSDAHANPWG